MIEFKSIELSDKGWIDPLVWAGNLYACHQNFTNLFVWRDSYNQRAAKVNDYLVIKTGKEADRTYYFYPAGSGDVKPVLEAMMDDAQANGSPFVMIGVLPEQQALLETLYPDQFRITPDRDNWDYLYQLDKLASLKGKKLHGKRNHINRFIEGGNWSFEELTPENLDECWKMNVEWCKINGCSEEAGLQQEACAVRKTFDNYTALGVEGGVLRQEGRIVAYTMGEKLCSDTFVTHIEKAFGDIQGAYPMINREFAAQIQRKHPEIIYVNREEDVGDEGLRRAKMSYYPERMAEKAIARLLI